MITCDRCAVQILGGERVIVSTKNDPYGDDTDWCNTCADELNKALAVARDDSRIALRLAISGIMNKWHGE